MSRIIYLISFLNKINRFSLIFMVVSGVTAYPVAVIGDRGQIKQIKITRIKEVYEVRQ